MAEAIRARAALALAISLAGAGPIRAQSVDVAYGLWNGDALAVFWSAGYRRALMGPVDYSVALTHLDDHRSPLNRTQTGVELSVGLWRDGSGPYGLVGT